MLIQCSISIPSEDARKTLVSYVFEGCTNIKNQAKTN